MDPQNPSPNPDRWPPAPPPHSETEVWMPVMALGTKVQQGTEVGHGAENEGNKESFHIKQ